jgi:ATP-binding cassette subfamily B protein
MNWWQRLFTKKQSNTATEQLSLKDRVSALRNLPRFFGLVWQSSPGMMIGNISLRILRSAIPLAMLYVGKLIIDGIVHLKDAEISHDYLWQLVAIEFGLAILSDVLSRGVGLLDSLIGDLFANSTSIKIMQHAARLDLEQFEDSQFYDKLERARQQTVGRTMLLSQVLSQVQDSITMAFLAVGLVAFNPWLILLLGVAVVPAFLGESHFNNRSYALNRRQTPERRELDYIRYVGASDETAKEVKTFNLSGFFVDRFRGLSTKFYNDNKTLSQRRAGWGTAFSFLGSAGYYGAYVFIINQAINGTLSIGDVTFLAGSFRQLRGLLEGILGRFTSVSQVAILKQSKGHKQTLNEFLNEL